MYSDKSFTLSIVVLTYNRHDFLRRFLESLASQDYSKPYQVVICDNGSDQAITNSQLAEVPNPLAEFTLVRRTKNMSGSKPWGEAWSHAYGDFVTSPGDDDVLDSTHLSTLTNLATSGENVTLASTGVRQVTRGGRRIGQDWVSPDFRSGSQAWARLFENSPYPFPATAFRRDCVDLSLIPHSRTSIDWWLWTQCWLKGRAVTSGTATVDYTIHQGQEQNSYGTFAFRLDAYRMLTALQNSAAFRDLVANWSTDEVNEFVHALLKSPGPIGGDSRWGTMLQIQLAEQLRGRVSDALLVDLYAQAAAHSGYIPEKEALRSVVPSWQGKSLPKWTWSRLGVNAKWPSRAGCLEPWRSYLQLPESSAEPRIELEFTVVAGSHREANAALRVRGKRIDTGQGFSLALPREPDMSSARELLDQIAFLKGIERGFEPLGPLSSRLWLWLTHPRVRTAFYIVKYLFRNPTQLKDSAES